ncbi:MAG TPA: type I methionyl aminopeptidase [Gemmatimonadota bacterium]|nr:type I methionyl aminopeptidase [Gemmatimonadota bacterium]
MVTLKSTREIARMRDSGRIVAAVLAAMAEAVRPGVTTAELDRLAESIIRGHDGARPAFKGYGDRGHGGFPASICASVNEEVVHGIPSRSRRLEAGDIVGVDVGVLLHGYHADAARTFAVGAVAPRTRSLLGVTREALEAGIAAAQPGGHVGDISHAIQAVAEAAGFSIVRDLVGHGIGQLLHEDPQVPNFGVRGRGLKLEPGLVIAIEPMVNCGDSAVRTLDDTWTIVTVDGKCSAHFEHTVAITAAGPEVLTRAA